MRRINTTFALLFLVAIGPLGSPSVDAATIGIDFTNGVVGSIGTPPRTNGFEFILSEEKTVTALGFWDEGPTGPTSLALDHIVSLWDVATGTQLATVVVDNGSEVVASTQTAGNWRFKDLLSTVVLAPGSYVVGSEFTGSADQVRTNTDPQNPNSLVITPAPFLTVVQGRSGLSGANPNDIPPFPNSNITLGPNLRFADAAVPEPACASLMLLSFGAMVVRRTRTRMQ